MRATNPEGVLAMLFTISVLGVLGTWVVAAGMVRASRRLAIDWPTTLVWLGLAEWPPEEGVPTRAQLANARAQARRARAAAAGGGLYEPHGAA
ncbi:MAG TPA: hypothetical protein VGW11_10065 [Solirubrobacteraceae bacterium]|nr:hypothetical protein [Solirubrobacteraceae bacterium]